LLTIILGTHSHRLVKRGRLRGIRYGDDLVVVKLPSASPGDGWVFTAWWSAARHYADGASRERDAG